MYWSGAEAGSSSASTEEGSIADYATISAQYTGGSGIGGITPLVYNPESDGPPAFHSGVFTGDHGSVQFVQTADSGNQGTGEGDSSQSDGKSRARSWWGIRGWFLVDEPIDDGGSQVVQTADTGTDGKTTSKSGGSLIATMGDLADDAGSYVGRSSKSLILGDWTDEKPTGLSIGAGIGLGVLGVDLPLDLRDLGHTLTHREWTYKWGETLAYNSIGLIPLIGVLKNLKRLKNLDDAGELAKRSDDAADAAGDAGRRADSPSNPPPDAPANPQSVESVAPNKAWPRATSEYIDETRSAFEKSGGVRERFWKNEFETNSSSYSPQNQALIKQGKAPFGTDGKPMVLHHVTPIEYGGSNNFSNLRPMRYSDHSLSPNFGPLHTPPFPE